MATLTRMPPTTGRTTSDVPVPRNPASPATDTTTTTTEAITTPTTASHPLSRGLRWWSWAALLGYTGVVVALTCLKAWFTIGLLWKPENQRVRELRLQPFGIVDDASSPFGAAFDILGNVALFVPLGLMLVLVVRRFWWPVLACAGFSFAVEVTQYVFSLGRTDVTDLICNTAGGLVGALLAVLLLRLRPRMTRRAALVCTGLVTVLVLGFVVLVILGPSLAGETVPVDEGPSFVPGSPR